MITVHRTLRRMGLLGASALTMAIGCASPGPERIDPRGNYPDVGPGNSSAREAGGVLIVSTPTRSDVSSGRTLTGGPEMRPPVVHSGYTVFNSEGAFVRHVPNHSLAPSTDEAPEEVVLPPGRYLVQPDEPGTGQDRFWVTVEAARETRVDVARIESPRTPEAR